MKVFLHEISDEPKHLHFSEQDPWVATTVRETEESRLEKASACSVDLELRRSQDIVFVKGKLDAKVGLLCSRCANSFGYGISSHFQCLFTRERGLANTNENVGVAHSEPTGATEEDLDIELLDKEYIELADVVKEQIYLKIPVQPLCNDECKGICPTCGQDRNLQPCQCHRIKNNALANALKNYRIR